MTDTEEHVTDCLDAALDLFHAADAGKAGQWAERVVLLRDARRKIDAMLEAAGQGQKEPENGKSPWAKKSVRVTQPKRIAEALADGPLVFQAIVDATGIVKTSLYATINMNKLYFRKTAGGLWELTPSGRRELLDGKD